MIPSTHIDLLNRLAEPGTQTGWEEFFDRYGELIRSFALAVGVSLNDCDDVVQDVLISLSKSMGKFQYDPQKGKFRSYLKTVTTHAVFKKFRQAEGQPALFIDEDNLPEANQELENHWEYEWRNYHVRRALRTLSGEFSQQHCRAFFHYAIEGHSASETAKEFEMTVESVWQIKSRMMKKLSETVQRQIEEEG